MNRRSFFWIFTFVVLGTFVDAAFSEDGSNSNKNKSYAVLFGVEKFPNLASFGDLSAAVNDMTAFRERWFDAEEFEGRVYSLVEGAAGPNALAPTRANFEKTLDKLATLTEDKDAVYICVATHGIAAFSRSFLCPSDAKGADLSGATQENVAEKADELNLISVSSLIERLGKIKGRKVLIIDACREKVVANDNTSHFLQEFEDRLRKSSHANLAVVASCCLGQFAHNINDETNVPRGRFGYYFLEGLEGKADFTGAYDGQITLIEAYNYANVRTKRDAEASGQIQTPELYEANDANNPLGVDRLVLAEYDLFGKKVDASRLARESDVLFALHAGDALTKTQKELEQGVPNEYPLIEELVDFTLQAQPGNRLARTLRGYSRRAQTDYAGALEDFERVGVDFILFVNKATHPRVRDANNNWLYNRSLIYRTPDGPAEELYDVTVGDILTIDQVDAQTGRLHVASWNSRPPKFSFWVDASSVGWTQTQAESIIYSTPATVRNNPNTVFGSTSAPATTGGDMNNDGGGGVGVNN